MGRGRRAESVRAPTNFDVAAGQRHAGEPHPSMVCHWGTPQDAGLAFAGADAAGFDGGLAP